jgi:hypothetical protein
VAEALSSTFGGDGDTTADESLLALVARTTGLALSAVVVLTGYSVEWLWQAISSQNGWIVFFLVAKPLIDLSWRWEFIRFSEQRINVQAIVGVCIIIFTCLRIWRLRKSDFHAAPVLVMLLLAMLSVMYSPSSWGFNELIRLFAGVAFFFIAGQALARQVVFDKFAIAFITVVSLPVVLAFLQAAKIIPFDYWDWIDGKQIGRASGTYDTPLSLVYFLMYTIPLTLYLLERRNSWPLRLSLGASLLALVFTYHRTAFIAITVELLIWFLLKGQYKLVLGLCAAGFLAVVLYAGAFSTLYEPLTDAVEGNVDVSGDEFLRGRGVIWATFLADYAQGNPIHWLIGRGGSVLNGTLFLDEMGENDPHNDFVRLLHDYGAIGIFAYLTVLWRLTTRARRFRGSNTFLDGIARLFLVSLVALLILSFTGEPMRYPSAVWYLFSLASILCYFDTPTRRLPALP